MRKFLYRMNETVAHWMMGRYGVDELSRFLLLVSAVLFILSNFQGMYVLYYPAVVFMILSLFRCWSRRVDKRTRERSAYLKARDKVGYTMKIRHRMWAERKTHKYFKCSRCGMLLRVPKGVGKIIITCPRCKEKEQISS